MDNMPAVEPLRERTELWIRAGLADLYGSERLDQMVEKFSQFLAEHAITLFNGATVDWDRLQGSVLVRVGGSSRELTSEEWAHLADMTAFDRWLAQIEAAEAVLHLAVTQLGRAGVNAMVTMGPHGEGLVQLRPHQVLVVLESAIRARAGTPGWDAVDQTAAELLLGVGQPGSNPVRDAAIRSAPDPWIAALLADAPDIANNESPRSERW